MIFMLDFSVKYVELFCTRPPEFRGPESRVLFRIPVYRRSKKIIEENLLQFEVRDA